MQEAGETVGFEMQCYDPERITVTHDKQPSVWIENQPIVARQMPVFCINRLGALTPDRSVARQRHLEAEGIICVNAAFGTDLARDKLSTFSALAGNFPVPNTLRFDHATNLDLIGDLLGYPVILKPTRGSQGQGIELLNRDDLSRRQQKLESSPIRCSWIVQQYVPSSHGKDVRVLVVNDEPIYAVHRTSANGALVSHARQGGRMRRARLSHELASIAQRVCEVLHLWVGGVDLLFSKAGYVVCGANCSPGFEYSQAVYNDCDIASVIMQGVLKHVSSELFILGDPRIALLISRSNSATVRRIKSMPSIK